MSELAVLRPLDFYPRPPRGGRPVGRCTMSKHIVFLSTSSARRTTDNTSQLKKASEISIHVLREEDDPIRRMIRHSSINFYPRPPRGGRRWSISSWG